MTDHRDLFHCIEGRYDGDPHLSDRILTAFCTCISARGGNPEPLRILMARSRSPVLGDVGDRAMSEAIQANMVGAMAHLGFPDNHPVTEALRAAGMEPRSAEDVAKVEMMLSMRRDLADLATHVWVSGIVARSEWKNAGQDKRIRSHFLATLDRIDRVRSAHVEELAAFDLDFLTLLTGLDERTRRFTESDLLAAGFPTVAER